MKQETLLEFFQRSDERLKKWRKKQEEECQRIERMSLGLNEADYQKYLENKAENDKIANQLANELLDAEIEAKRIENEEKLRLKKEGKILFAKSLGFNDESFHLATLVSIRHVNEFSGGTRKNNRVHIIMKDRSLFCGQKTSGGTALSSDWFDNIPLDIRNVTCPKCLKKIK